MPMVPNQQITVGGNTLYPTQGLLDPNRDVYRPVQGTSGLLSSGEMDNLVRDFAGGLLNGYQVSSTPNDQGMYVTPIAPSGVYTTNPDQAAPSTPEADQGGGLSLYDAIALKYGARPMGPMRGGIGSITNLLDPAQAPGRKKLYADAFGVDFDAPYNPNDEGQKKLLASLQRDYETDNTA